MATGWEQLVAAAVVFSSQVWPDEGWRGGDCVVVELEQSLW